MYLSVYHQSTIEIINFNEEEKRKKEIFIFKQILYISILKFDLNSFFFFLTYVENLRDLRFDIVCNRVMYRQLVHS